MLDHAPLPQPDSFGAHQQEARSSRRRHLSIVPPVAPRRRSTGAKRTSRRAAAVPKAPQVELGAEARRLLSLYAPLVQKIASGFQRRLPRNVLRDDLVAAGMGGLWDAILKHGDQHDDGFEWYVRVRVRGAIVDELRAQDWLPRRARTKPGEDAPSVVRIEDVSTLDQSRCLAGVEMESAEAAAEQRSERVALEAAIGKLPERERHIVASHYFGGIKFKDLGAELGVSEPRISQLHSRAMKRLRGLLDEAA